MKTLLAVSALVVFTFQLNAGKALPASDTDANQTSKTTGQGQHPGGKGNKGTGAQTTQSGVSKVIRDQSGENAPAQTTQSGVSKVIRDESGENAPAQTTQSGVSKVIRDQSGENAPAKSGKGAFNQHPGGKNKGATAGVGANTTGKAGTGGSVGATGRRRQNTAHTQIQKQEQKQTRKQTRNRQRLQAHTTQQEQRRGKPTLTPGSAAILSDLRMKKDVSLVGWSPMGIPIYRFSYINQPNKCYQGTIAQAIVRLRPDAIVWRDGLMWVDYSRLDVRMEELPPAPAGGDGHLSPP